MGVHSEVHLTGIAVDGGFLVCLWKLTDRYSLHAECPRCPGTGTADPVVKNIGRDCPTWLALYCRYTRLIHPVTGPLFNGCLSFLFFSLLLCACLSFFCSIMHVYALAVTFIRRGLFAVGLITLARPRFVSSFN